MSTTDTTQFEIIDSNIVLRVEVNPSNMDRQIYTHGSLAKLSDGELWGRSQTTGAAGLVRYNYGRWSADHKRADIVNSPDPVAALDAIVANVQERIGVHGLDLNPPPTELEGFLRGIPKSDQP